MIPPVSTNHFRAFFILFAITGGLALVTSGDDTGNPLPTLRRISRSISQLGRLVEANTQYRAGDFVYYGNWCGFGGNRAGDGSVRDPCDACCKAHDGCYSELLYWTRGEDPPPTYSNSNENVFFRRLLRVPQSQLRNCVPYTDLYFLTSSQECMNIGGYCSRRTCECDLQFVNCLKRTQCEIRSRRNYRQK